MNLSRQNWHIGRSAIGVLLLAASCAEVQQATDPTDSDAGADVPRVELRGRWTSTSIPERGWWDFPWQDAEGWCGALTPTDAEFETQTGDPLPCWEGTPSSCYQSVRFADDGALVWFVSAVVTTCGEDPIEVSVAATRELEGSWTFAGISDDDLDQFEVKGAVWTFRSGADSDTYTVEAAGRTYDMLKQEP